MQKLRYPALSFSRHGALALSLLVGAGLFWLARAVWLTQASVDTWTYLELARSMSEGHYRFVTWRNYVADTFSVSFPFAYPALLALVGSVLGWKANLGMLVNAVIAGASVWVVMRIGRQLGWTGLTGSVVALCLVLNPFYLEEVMAGRAIPLALLFWLGAGSSLLSGRVGLAGLFAGLAALTRFDFLVHGMVLFLGWAYARGISKPTARAALRYGAMALAGFSPWLAYSLGWQGTLLATESGWLAWAAHPASVLQFPAAALASLADAPLAWAWRVAANGWHVAQSWVHVLAASPLTWAVSVLALMSLRHDSRQWRYVLGAGLLVGVSWLPYALAGFSAERYQVPAALALTGVLASLAQAERIRRWQLPALLAGLAASGVLGGMVITNAVTELGTRHATLYQQSELLTALARCHRAAPGVTLVFGQGQHLAGAWYGAVYRQPAALSPYGFARMNPAELGALEGRIGKFEALDGTGAVGRCADLAPKR